MSYTSLRSRPRLIRMRAAEYKRCPQRSVMAQRQFADPEERARIIARRDQLSRDLIEYIVTRSPNDQEARAQLNPIVREYGFDEVYRMLEKISPRLNAAKDP